MAAAGVFSQISGAQALTGRAAPMAASGAGSNGADGSGAGTATVSANDFLTLLVTEMKNQDPTAQTDPNEYVNQLVAVNSLEQLIGINQTLTSALGTPGTGGSSTPATQESGTQTAGPMAHSLAAPAGAPALAHTPAMHVPAPEFAPGNLSIPAANPAADRVAHALDGRSHPFAVPGAPAIR